MKKLLSFAFIMAILIAIPEYGTAVVQPKVEKNNNVEGTLNATDILNLDKKEIEEKLGRKLKLKEKIALRILKRKLRKQANKNPEKLKMEPGAVLGFSFSVASIVATLAFLLSGYGILFIFLFGILGTIFSSIALRKTSREGATKRGKGLALTGMIMGIAVTGTWLLSLLIVLILFAYGY